MMSTLTARIRAWFAGAVALGIAAASVTALAQVPSLDQRRESQRQQFIQRFEDWLDRLATAGELIDCATFRGLSDNTPVGTQASQIRLDPAEYGEWARATQARLEEVLAVGCRRSPVVAAASVPLCPNPYRETELLNTLGGVCRCHGASEGRIWGTGTYTADSNICRAAVHAGAIPRAGGIVRVTRQPGQDNFEASRRNGVWSDAWRFHASSFTVSRADPPYLIQGPFEDHGARRPPSLVAGMTIQPYAPVVRRPAQPPLPTVRPRELDWSPDLYQRYREQVEGLRELRADGQCDGSRGYLAGLQNLQTDLQDSLEVARRGGVDVFRIRRPVIEYFQSWLAAASAAGCVQAGSSSPPPVATPAPMRPRFAGRYQTDFGELILTDTGGIYDAGTARLVITQVYGNTAEGNWVQDNAAERCPNGGFQGRFEFTFTATGFTGRYGRCGEPLTRPWNGVREGSSARPAPPPAPGPAPPVATPRPPSPDARPRYPVDMPGFNHLPGVKPAEPGWDTGLYNLWSDQMRRLDNLREIGDCDDRRGYGYWRALREHRASVEREFARLRTATPEQYRAWQPVISYFRGRTYNWERDYGCTQVPG